MPNVRAPVCVITGLLRPADRRVNVSFSTSSITKTPHVVKKMAQVNQNLNIFLASTLNSTHATPLTPPTPPPNIHRALVQALGLERQIKLITQLIPTRDGRRAAEAITGIPGDPRAVPASESSIISGPVAAVEAFQTHYGVKRHHVESSICNGLPPWGDSDVKRPKLSLEAVIESVGGVAQLTRLLLDSYDDLLEQAAAAENKKSADEATVANVTEQLCSWLHWHGVWLVRYF